MGMLETQRFVAVVRFGKEDNGAYEEDVSPSFA
jgi:hypothetical protein